MRLASKISHPANRITHDSKKSCCLLGCRTFFNRPGLTRYIERFYLDTGTFDSLFLCLEYLISLPAEESLICSLPDWCNHLASRHRKKDAPDLPPGTHTRRQPRDVCEKLPKTLACPICKRWLSDKAGLRRHITVTHYKRGYFKNCSFPCPAYERTGVKPAQIDSYETFTDHCVKMHGTPLRTSQRGWGATAKEATPDLAEPRVSKRKRNASTADTENQGPEVKCKVSAKQRRRTVGNAVSEGSTLYIDLSFPSPPTSAPDSPSLPPHPPNTSALPIVSGVGRDYSPSPEPFAWPCPDLDTGLTRNPWLE